MLNTDEKYMAEAVRQAGRAMEEGEIPVGAVIVSGDTVIARGYNQVERLKDPTAHAEMIALTSAANFLTSAHLHDCTLYVTLQPCPMCMGAIREAQIGRVVYGAAAPEGSAVRWTPEVEGGQSADACEALLNEFFARLRN